MYWAFTLVSLYLSNIICRLVSKLHVNISSAGFMIPFQSWSYKVTHFDF